MKRYLWVLLAGLLFWTALGNFIFSTYRLSSTFSQTRQQLMLVASNAALCIDARQLLQVPLQQSGDGSVAYRAIFEKLEIIKQINPFLKYVYIMTATDEPGILQYVVDADPVPQVITARSPSALPGDKYDARQLPEMLEAYNGPTADKKNITDEWGVFISGYAPIRDANGKPVAILGVDADAAQIYVLQKNVRLSGFWVTAAFFIFIISLFGCLIFRSRKAA